MAENSKLNLLDQELDEESQKYIQETLSSWKESVTNQLIEQMEKEKQAKIEELEEENLAYREALKEEFTEKMLDGLNELKESIRAEVTAEVIKNNPELKIFEQVKEIVAPLVTEGYRDNAYADTIERLSEENEKLKREAELNEGAKVLADLLEGYSEKTQKLVLSLIKEGSPEEVSEQFYNIVETLSEIFEAEEKDSDENEDTDDEDKEEKDSEDEDDEDSEKDEDDEDSEEDEDEETKNEEYEEDSYITEGVKGLEETPEQKFGTMKSVLNHYARA